MLTPRARVAVFLIEGLNSLGTTYYFYYVFFLAESMFGFGRLQNLLLGAGLGLTYAAAAVAGGKFAQGSGYFRALKLGSLVMAASLAAGSQVQGLGAHLIVMLICTFGMGQTWPALQALISEGERGRRLQTLLGVYNLVWAGFGAVAYLTGGAMIEAWGLRSLFIVPAVLHGLQCLLACAVSSRAHLRPAGSVPEPAEKLEPVIPRAGPPPRVFLRMAWLANPFAYLAINTVVAVIPSLARGHELSPRYAGYFCSIWMFTRAGAFLLFWLWPGWHYRFRWLVNAYIGMIASFVAILLAPGLAGLLIAQIAFGLCIGLIYYSSLFYSMDVGETKGEHGGIHEAAIGAGSCAGPAVGALALWLVPGHPSWSTLAVGGLLMTGLVGLLWMRRRSAGHGNL